MEQTVHDRLRTIIEKADYIAMDELGQGHVYEELKSIAEKAEADYYKQGAKSTKTAAIRTFLSSVKKEAELEVAISAMREKELLDLINRYDTTESQVLEAYDRLRTINSKKYKHLEL